MLIIIFPPLAKNLLTTTQEVASLFTATLSIGIAMAFWTTPMRVRMMPARRRPIQQRTAVRHRRIMTAMG